MSEEVAEKIDPDALAKSLNGFEEIAIRAMFRAKLEDLAQDSTMFMRALVFVMHKRGGMKDSDAFQTVMATALDEVVAQFGAPEEESADPEAQAELDKAYADFVVGVGLSFTPDQYRALTLSQRGALVDAANRRG